MGVHVCNLIETPEAVQNLAWEKICVPPFVICNPNPDTGPIRKCEETWNHILCPTDDEFFMRYDSGDKLQFQVKARDLHHEDPTLPIAGWNTWIHARLVNNDTGETLSEDVADFCSMYYVAHNGLESYQVIEVDTSMEIFEGVKCWHIEFWSTYILEGATPTTVINPVGCTEDWCNCHDCEIWPMVEAIHEDYDGHSYYHGLPNAWFGNSIFKFEPKYRFPFELVQTGGGTQREETQTGILTHETSLIFTGATITPVPPYVLNMFLLGFLTGKSIIFAGKKYSVLDQTIGRSNTRSEMLIFQFELFQNENSKSKHC